MITAWLGEPKIKDAAMQRLRQHKQRDEIVHEIYWSRGKGCHLGCLTHTGSDLNESAHIATNRLFGIPIKVTYWLEMVFEQLRIEDAKCWVINSTDAIPVGADLSRADNVLCAWLLDPATGFLKITDVNRAQFRSLHLRIIDGEKVTDEEWMSADGSASYSNSRDVACDVSYTSAWAAAAEAADYATAYKAAWKKIAAKSIEIFRSAPIVECDPCSKRIADSLAHLNAE